MNHIIAFSGGIASSVMAEIVIKMYPNAILLYHDTKTEPSDNDRFRKEVATYLGRPITNDSDGRTIWEVFDDEGYLGNGRNTMCSRILKQQRSLRFIQSHMPAILYVGFTPDEWRRAQRVQARYESHQIEVKFPLITQALSKKECFSRVTRCWKIAPPKMYEWADHANCIPCIKGKKAYWGLVYMYEREAWNLASQYEEKFGNTIFTESGSLKEELAACLRLAEKRLKKKKADESQEELFVAPCECMV